MVCEQLSDMALIILPHKHPFRAMYVHLTQRIHGKVDGFTLLALYCVVSACEKALGPFNMHIVYTAQIMMEVVSMRHGPEAVEAPLNTFSQACDQHCGPSAIQSPRISYAAKSFWMPSLWVGELWSDRWRCFRLYGTVQSCI